MLPKQAFTGFASRYRQPSLDEGFEDITKVDFQVRGLVLERKIPRQLLTIIVVYWYRGAEACVVEILDLRH